VEIRFWQSTRGDIPVAAYFERLESSGDGRGVAAYRFLLELLAEIGPPLGRPRDRVIDRTADLYELRPGAHRVAYVRRGETVWLLHAWRKQSRKLDDRALKTALGRVKELDRG
jgi:phage-related protein